MTFLELFTSNSQYNYGNWENEKYDALINKASTNFNNKTRMEQLRTAENMLGKEAVIIPIYNYSMVVVSKPNLQGVYTPIDRLPMFEFADIVQ